MLSKVSLLVLLALGAAQATTYTFTNVFPDNHVVGDATKFAIQSVIVDVSLTQVKVTLDTNYENANLSPFSISAGHNYTLQVGDFFFMAAGAAPQFGVAIESHGGMVNGFNTGNTVSNTNLYAINNPSGVLKSDDVINKQPGDGIRFNNGVNVWLRDIVIGGNHTITAEAGASVTPVSTPLAKIGNGTTIPLYQIAFTINRPGNSSDPFNQLIDSNAWAFQFESADCANDYFSGAVPEPGTLALMGLGFVALSLKSRTVRSTFRNVLRPRSS